VTEPQRVYLDAADIHTFNTILASAASHTGLNPSPVWHTPITHFDNVVNFFLGFALIR